MASFFSDDDDNRDSSIEPPLPPKRGAPSPKAAPAKAASPKAGSQAPSRRGFRDARRMTPLEPRLTDTVSDELPAKAKAKAKAGRGLRPINEAKVSDSPRGGGDGGRSVSGSVSPSGTSTGTSMSPLRRFQVPPKQQQGGASGKRGATDSPRAAAGSPRGQAAKKAGASDKKGATDSPRGVAGSPRGQTAKMAGVSDKKGASDSPRAAAGSPAAKKAQSSPASPTKAAGSKAAATRQPRAANSRAGGSSTGTKGAGASSSSNAGAAEDGADAGVHGSSSAPSGGGASAGDGRGSGNVRTAQRARTSPMHVVGGGARLPARDASSSPAASPQAKKKETKEKPEKKPPEPETSSGGRKNSKNSNSNSSDSDLFSDKSSSSHSENEVRTGHGPPASAQVPQVPGLKDLAAQASAVASPAKASSTGKTGDAEAQVQDVPFRTGVDGTVGDDHQKVALRPLQLPLADTAVGPSNTGHAAPSDSKPDAVQSKAEAELQEREDKWSDREALLKRQWEDERADLEHQLHKATEWLPMAEEDRRAELQRHVMKQVDVLRRQVQTQSDVCEDFRRAHDVLIERADILEAENARLHFRSGDAHGLTEGQKHPPHWLDNEAPDAPQMVATLRVELVEAVETQKALEEQLRKEQQKVAEAEKTLMQREAAEALIPELRQQLEEERQALSESRKVQQTALTAAEMARRAQQKLPDMVRQLYGLEEVASAQADEFEAERRRADTEAAEARRARGAQQAAEQDAGETRALVSQLRQQLHQDERRLSPAGNDEAMEAAQALSISLASLQEQLRVAAAEVFSQSQAAHLAKAQAEAARAAEKAAAARALRAEAVITATKEAMTATAVQEGDEDGVDLIFDRPYGEGDHATFKGELLHSLEKVGVDTVILEGVQIEFREGSLVAELRGATSVVAVLRRLPLEECIELPDGLRPIKVIWRYKSERLHLNGAGAAPAIDAADELRHATSDVASPSPAATPFSRESENLRWASSMGSEPSESPTRHLAVPANTPVVGQQQLRELRESDADSIAASGSGQGEDLANRLKALDENLAGVEQRMTSRLRPWSPSSREVGCFGVARDRGLSPGVARDRGLSPRERARLLDFAARSAATVQSMAGQVRSSSRAQAQALEDAGADLSVQPATFGGSPSILESRHSESPGPSVGRSPRSTPVCCASPHAAPGVTTCSPRSPVTTGCFGVGGGWMRRRLGGDALPLNDEDAVTKNSVQQQPPQHFPLNSKLSCVQTPYLPNSLEKTTVGTGDSDLEGDLQRTVDRLDRLSERLRDISPSSVIDA